MTLAEKRARARRLRRDGKSIREIAADLEVSVNTAHRYVNEEFEARQLLRNQRNAERRRRERRRQEETTEP